MQSVQIKKTLTASFAMLSACVIISCDTPTGDGGTADTASAMSKVDGKMDSATSTGSATHAEVMLSGTKADTTVDGKATFDAADGKVTMKLDLTIPKMANKSVAVHIHDMPDCGDMGMATHGHWNPTKKEHGKWGEGSFHLGDIGNVKLDKDGKGTAEISTDLWTIGSDTLSSVLNHALIVHSGVDDYKSQPAGNSGSRIGCGVIK